MQIGAGSADFHHLAPPFFPEESCARKDALDLILSILEHVMEAGVHVCNPKAVWDVLIWMSWAESLSQDPEDSKRRTMSCLDHPGTL